MADRRLQIVGWVLVAASVSVVAVGLTVLVRLLLQGT